MLKILSSMAVSMLLLLTGVHLQAQTVTPEMQEARKPGEVEINTPTLPSASEVIGTFSNPAVREVEIRRLNPEQVNVNNSFLATDLSKNLLIQIGRQLPSGRETQVDFRTLDGQRFRVEREENGEVRIGVRDAVLSRDDARALAKSLSDAGIGRVEIRAVDRDGNQVRLELRDGLVKKEEIRPDDRGRGREGTSARINNERARDMGKDLDHSIRGRERAEREQERKERERVERLEKSGTDTRVERSEKLDRGQRLDRRDRIDRSERVERSERPERRERGERIERLERTERPERHERIERAERVDRPERAERAERGDRLERIERVERPHRVERVERPERVERIERPERHGRRD